MLLVLCRGIKGGGWLYPWREEGTGEKSTWVLSNRQVRGRIVRVPTRHGWGQVLGEDHRRDNRCGDNLCLKVPQLRKERRIHQLVEQEEGKVRWSPRDFSLNVFFAIEGREEDQDSRGCHYLEAGTGRERAVSKEQEIVKVIKAEKNYEMKNSEDGGLLIGQDSSRDPGRV